MSQSKKEVRRRLLKRTPFQPINLYARTKRMAEVVIEEFCAKYELQATVLRFFNHVHSSQKAGTFLSTLYQEMLKQKALTTKEQ